MDLQLDPATLAIGASIGGGVGTLAALVIWALIARFVYRSWMELDAIRDRILSAQTQELQELRKRLERLESRDERRSNPGPGSR